MTAIANRANTTVAAQGAGFRITKSGGVNGAFDASAVSATVAGDVLLRLDPPANTAHRAMLGLSLDPTVDNNFASINYAVQFFTNWVIWESGVSFVAGGPATQPMWIVRTGDVLRYMSGANGPSLLHRTVAGVSAALGFDSSLFTAGGVFDVQFDPFTTWLPPLRGPRRIVGGLRIGL